MKSNLPAVCSTKFQSRVLFFGIWNTIIWAYAWAGPFQQSIHLYHQLHFPVCSQSMLRSTSIATLLVDIYIIMSTYLASQWISMCPWPCLTCMYVAICLKYRHYLILCTPTSIGILLSHGMPWLVSFHFMHFIYTQTLHLLSQMYQAGTTPNSSTIVSILLIIG